MASLKYYIFNMYFRSIMLLVFCSTAFSNEHFPGGRKGWFRVCNSNKDPSNLNSNQHYEVEADKCPHGAWLSDGLEGGCVCLNGVWAISQSWCDEDYYVAYGKGHCFKLNKQIQKLSFLGHEENAFEPMNFITKENGHVFQQFNDEYTMPYEFSRDINKTILRLRPSRKSNVLMEFKPDLSPDEELYARLYYTTFGEEDEEIAMDSGPVCIKSSSRKEDSEYKLVVYKVSTGIKYIRTTESCPEDDHSFDDEQLDKGDMAVMKLVPGQALHVKSGTVIEASHGCPLDCSQTHLTSPIQERVLKDIGSSLIRHKRQAKNSSVKNSSSPSVKNSSSPSVKNSSSPSVTSGFEPMQLDREFLADEKDEIVNTANMRVVKQELNWLLEGVRPPTIDTPSWKIMQKIKEIFNKVCPNTETPIFLVNAMLRLFRLFYLNSRDFYPNGHMIEEQDQYQRINATLDTCLSEAQAFSFTYAKAKVEGKPCRKEDIEEYDEGGNGTGGPTKVTYCPCRDELDLVNVTFTLNLTGTPESFNLTGENLTLPEHLRFQLPTADIKGNTTFHDFPTETVWKMVSFVHLYCSKYFRYQGGDHSALMTKMEDYFNEDIIYRWTHPGSFSDKIWQFLYSAFNFKKFAYSVDACLAGAKFVSDYPEHLNRPTLSMTRRKKRSLDSQKLWTGSAFCLEDPWDPINKLGVPSSEECVDFNRI